MKNHYGTLTVLGIMILEVILGVAMWSHKTPPATPASGAYQVQQIGGGGGAQPKPAFGVATNYPCVIPVSATSSIEHFSFQVTAPTSSAATLVVGTTTSATATSTTPFATFVVPANATYTFTWNGGVNNDVASPNTYVVAGMTNGSAVSYGYTYGGYCGAVIIAD